MLYNEDCLETMARMEDHSIDAIITDPPYFLTVAHYQTRKQFRRNFTDLGILEHFYRDVFTQFERILKPTGVLYIFCDGQSYPIFYYYLFPYCKSVRPLIWDKKVCINGYSWRHQHELIIFAERPHAPVIPTGDGDIMRHNAVKVGDRKHPAEKPVELLEQLITKSTPVDAVIYDPFAGSGSTVLACMNLNRNYIASEISKDYFDIMKARVTNHKTDR